MIGPAIHLDGKDGIGGQYFDNVASLQVVLAEAEAEKWIRREPPRRLVADGRIGERLGDLLAGGGDVLEAAAEDPARDEARVAHDEAALAIAVLRVAGLEVVGVEAKHAAVAHVTAFEQKDVVEEKSRALH